MKISTVILFILLGIDAVSNLFLLMFYPQWEEVRRKEIEELKEQNAELRVFIKELLQDDTDWK